MIYLVTRFGGSDTTRSGCCSCLDRSQGLVLFSARWFAFDRKPRPFVRLGFAVRSAEESARAIERLAKLLPRESSKKSWSGNLQTGSLARFR